MAKISKKQKNVKRKQQQKSAPFKLETKHQDILFSVLFVVILVLLLKPLVIDGLSPQGVDVVASIGSSHQIKEFNEKTGEKALWNPYKFSGMPTYHRHSPVAFSIDNILGVFGKLFSGVFMYYLFGIFGTYLLFRYLNMSPLISFIGAVMFVLMPHFKSLYLEGHFAKFRAVFVLPWIVLAFKHFLDKKSILSAALFALAFGLQIRTQHYQIVFYTGLLIFAIGVYPFLKLLFDKNYNQFLKSTALLAVSLVLAILMAAQPLFLAKEYLPYSKRGKTTIDINNRQKQNSVREKDGVDINYATQWSTHPSEILTWFLPRFYGGMSAEIYTSNTISQLKGRQVPAYWGHMPFTQSYEYMGIITLMLAFIGIWFYRKDKMIISLLIYTGFLILLSFGRHFLDFYGLFFNYFPYFNKFRAPMMSVTITFFIVSFFAVFGLKYLTEFITENFDIKKHKNLLIILGGFFVLGIILWISGQSMSFVKAGESYKNPQVITLMKEVRQEFFFNDLTRYFVLILLAAGSIYAYLRQKMNFTILGIILACLILFDLISIQLRATKQYIDLKKVEGRYFKQSDTDKFLLSDKDVFRILPPASSMNDNRWAYYHQSVSGYSPIKMYTIEELIQNNIFAGWDKSLPINWNVMQMLNVKYIILQQEIQHEYLKLMHKDSAQKLYTYLFTKHLPRGFFVGDYKIITDEYQRLEFINQPVFKPDSIALVEEELPDSIFYPDSSFSQVKEFTPNKIVFDIYTNKQSLFVISDLYYPPGWKISLDGNDVDKIYKTDHALMSIIIPAGQHEIILRFEPDSYFSNIRLSYASLGIIYLVIVLSLVQWYRKRKE